MIKIIKYSIMFIIFSIIISLFVLYFYLLKGISIDNLDTKFININKLYIKIDKKIIFKAKNLKIKYKNQENNSSEIINFKKIKKNINRIYHTLQFFQIIQIKNLSYHNTTIGFFQLKNNMLTIDNNKIHLKGLINSKKKNLTFNIYILKFKSTGVIIHNIYNRLYFTQSQLDITSDASYRDLNSKFNITITNNLNIFYNGVINSLSKNTLAKFKQYLNTINNFQIAKIYINGTKEKCYFKINNISIKSKYANAKTSLVSGEFTIKKQKLFAHINKLFIKSNKYKITMKHTKIYANIKKDSIYIITKNSIIHNKHRIYLTNTKFSYFNNIAHLFIDKLNFKQNNINIILNKLKGKYDKNLFYAFVPTIYISNNKLNTFSQNNIIEYLPKNKQIILFIYGLKIKNKLFNINIKNVNSIYKNNIANGNIKLINFNMPNINANIFKNKFNYNLTNKILNITNNANITYKTIKNINLYNIKTTYKLNQNELHTYIPNSSLQNIKISNTNIYLKNNIINILFNTEALLSKRLTNILSKLNIKIPVYQKYGKNHIKAHIKYNINKNKLDTNIKIKVLNSHLILNKNNYLNIHKSYITLKNNKLFLSNTLLDYNKSIVNVSYYIKHGIINLSKSYIKTDGIFKKLNIQNIANLQNYPEKVFINLNGIDILLKNLKTKLLIRKNLIIELNKLSSLYPYVSYLKEYHLKDGKAKIIIGDKIKISSTITNTNQKIILKNLKPLKHITIHTIIDKNKYYVSNNDINVTIINSNNNMNIYGNYKNLDLNVTKFVDQNSSDSNITLQTKLNAKNTYIMYHKSKLYSKTLSIDYNKTYTKIVSLYNDRKILIKYDNGNFRLYGLNIREKTFSDLTNTDILRKPLLDLFILKNKGSNITYGFIDIKKGYVRQLKALTNILAFINLVPSIITFQPAGFSSKGYKIKHGHVDFIMLNNVILLKNLSIIGENMKFKGKGYIDLNTKTLNINIEVIMMVKLLNNIPIINYILFGNNGGMTLKIKLSGNMYDPKVSPNVTKNILMGPVNIIKRILLTPFRPFMEDK